MSSGDAPLVTDDADVPSPIDLQTLEDARAWALGADHKRPWRAEVRETIAELIRTHRARPQRILELGPGPGQLAEVVLRTCDVADYTLLDFSPPFLQMARDRIGDRTSVHYVLGDFTDEGWPALVTPPFDAVVAMQAAHETRHKRRLPALYAQAFTVLAPGGLLVVCDHKPDGFDEALAPLYATVEEQHAAMASAGLEHLTLNVERDDSYVCSAQRPQ